MTQKQTNSLNMFLTLLTFLEENNSNWSGNTVIAPAIQEFNSTVSTIQMQAGTQQSTNSKGYTSKKDHDKEALVNLAYKLGLRVKNYAVSINDLVLKQAVDFSRFDLETGKEANVLNRCKTIRDKANSVAAVAPVEYKITPQLITQVTKAIDAFTPDAALRNVASGVKAGATVALTSLFSSAKKQLRALDDLIKGDADDEDVDFVRNYFMMRKTADHSSRGAKKVIGSNAIAQTAS